MSVNVAIVYYSKSGATELLARAIANGVADNNGVPTLLRINDEEIVHGRYRNDTLLKQLVAQDVLVFGTPTHMGGVAAQFKTFIDATSGLWSDGKLAGKTAAGFTTGGSLHGEQDMCLQNLFVFAQQHGMLWMGTDANNREMNVSGCSLGLNTSNTDGRFSEHTLACARYFGHYLVRVNLSIINKEI